VEGAELEACKKWIRCHFSSIPTSLLERAYGPTFEEIEILAPTLDDYKAEFIHGDNCDGECDTCIYRPCEDQYYSEVPKIPMWGWVFVPDVSLDAEWIEENARKIYAECGIFVYRTDEIGVYLGINGAGYDFYEAHWLPLYRL